MAKQSQNQPKPFAAVCRDKSSIDVVVVGADSHMYHRAYSDSSWRDWKNLGGNFTSEAPALVASSTDRLDVFARDQTTKRLIHSAWKNGSWATEWNEPDGPEFVRSITVVSSQAGQLDIFGATSESLYYRSIVDDSWSDWVYWYGPFQSNLAAASWSTGHLDVFGVGNDSRMWQKTYDAEMGGWPPKDWSTSEFSDGSGDSDGHYASDPAVAAWPSQQLHLIILGDMGDHNNDHCYHSVYSSGEWSYYNEIAGSFRSQPSLVSWGEGRLDAVALSLDMKVWHRYYDSDQLQWQPVDWQWVGGESDHNLTFGTAPIIVARGPKQLAILAMAESDGSVMYLSGDGMKWGEWISLGKPPEQAKGWSPTSTSEGWVRPASNAPTSSGNIAHLTSSSVSTSRAGLDIGAIVGIAVGVGITVVAAAAALCWYWRKTHLKMQQRPESSIDKAKVLTNAHPAEDTISSAPVQELHADPVKPMLMSHPIADTSGAHELETGLP